MAKLNTITIAKQETAAAMVEAMASALGEALGWTVDGGSVWQSAEKTGLRFYFWYSGSIIYLAVGNENGSSYWGNTGTIAFRTSEHYCVNYIKSTNIIVVGANGYNAAPRLSAIIAQNADGDWKGITNGSYYAADSLSVKSIPIAYSNAAGISTSLVKCPDFWGGCMFKELYMVLSCPSTDIDKVLYIDGKYFRYIGYNAFGYAVEVEVG